jgi:hypothetical protein
MFFCSRFCRAWCMVALALLAFIAVGCGGSRQYPVTGKVVLPNGSPLTGGMVVFHPRVGEGLHSANGPIGSDGTYELRTFKPGDGVMPGTYKVTITPPPSEEDKPSPVPARYLTPKSTPLEYTVKPESNEYNITLTR